MSSLIWFGLEIYLTSPSLPRASSPPSCTWTPVHSTPCPAHFGDINDRPRKGITNKENNQGITKRCRLPLLTNSALVNTSPNAGGGGGGVAGSQPMCTDVHIT
jgi:hypothetical protein